MATHQFGGQWTERKLAALRDYLVQYQVIFRSNEAARKLRTVYVDAFAGTGERGARQSNDTVSLFGYGEETAEFQKGSVQVALGLANKFRHYVFIDSKASHVAALQELIEKDFSEISAQCEIVREDANVWLASWCARQDWRKQRAVVFLDPYGMSVAWQTIQAIARTQAIDLWILFPFAIGANRMMPNDVLPEKDWAIRLTKVFGTADWVNRCYQKTTTTDLFGSTTNSVTKIAGADEILNYFLERLREIFPHVVERPMILYNSNNSPMYALCFAAGNPKGGKTAIKIAAHLASKR